MNLQDKRSADLVHAIENLITAKLHDALLRPDGLARLAAHRASGVVSIPIRNAERELETTLSRYLASSEPSPHLHPSQNSRCS